jgi:uncharacterized membrane protein YgcG
MNTKLLLIAVAAVSLSSCSSVYKSGQTPDDVYYSPVRTYDAAVKTNEDRRDNNYNNYSYAERSQIRLGINNARWRYLDDYSYNPYVYGYSYGYYYNPYYCPIPVYNYGSIVTVNPKNSTPRMTNLAAYNTAYNNTNSNASSKYTNPVKMPVRNYNNTSRLSNTLNKIFNNGSNYNNSNNNNSNNSQNNSNQSSRSYTPSSSSNSSGSSSSGSSGASRPARNGKG